ncbi:MAG: phosphoribosylglycinamide formyltransferase [Actinobacteria bacterium]|nr:phosphoribosylglycinamide formyltransferase [Actinomycetota bacterium]MBV9933005.1 phosphoribosylglycinamide formyltransferase [Actinomycetota bacterium]
MNVGVLASGTGSNLESILEAGIPVVVVIADRPCRALEVAEQAGVASELVQRTSFGKDFDRDAYTHQVIEALKRHDVELVVMAGFGTIIPAVAGAYPGRVLNTHPALLPAFPGWHSVKEALDRGVKLTGVTVHIATEEVDAGPILAQEAVAVLPGDTEDTLHERIKEVERRLYPDTIRQVIEGTLP